jgi:hypothetical protein
LSPSLPPGVRAEPIRHGAIFRIVDLRAVITAGSPKDCRRLLRLLRFWNWNNSALHAGGRRARSAPPHHDCATLRRSETAVARSVIRPTPGATRVF